MKSNPATDVWPEAARIIEFGVRDAAVGESLIAAGFRYLGVVTSEPQWDRLANRRAKLANSLVVCRSKDVVRQNNADVLVLGGGTAAHLGRYRDFRHVKYVACPLRNGPLAVWTILFWLAQFLLGRLAWPRTVRVGRAPVRVVPRSPPQAAHGHAEIHPAQPGN